MVGEAGTVNKLMNVNVTMIFVSNRFDFVNPILGIGSRKLEYNELLCNHYNYKHARALGANQSRSLLTILSSWALF